MIARSKLDPIEREEVLLHYEIGRPIGEIAADFGLHPVYVRVLARRCGVDWRQRKVNWEGYRALERELRGESLEPSTLAAGTEVAEVTRYDHRGKLVLGSQQFAVAGREDICEVDLTRTPILRKLLGVTEATSERS